MDTSGVSRGAGNVTSSCKDMANSIRKIGVLIGSVFAVGKLVSFGKEMTELGSDLAEVQNVVDVTFGGMSGKVDEFAKNAIKQFGLSEKSAKQYASTMGAMLKSMQFPVDEALDMSLAMTGLAGDIASFYNLSADEAFAKIRSGISGETEPLKQLGINLSVANLEQYALTQGIKKSYTAMSQQEQTLLRYNYLLHVTADAQGDFERTSDGWANQTRILSERINSLKATLGQGLINALTPAVKLLSAMIEKLGEAAAAFAALTEVIGGHSTDGAADANSSLAESYDSVTEAVEKAEKAEKGYLSGLDEIKTYDTGNVDLDSVMPLPQDVVSDNGAAGQVGGLTEKIDELKQSLSELWAVAKKGFDDSWVADIEQLKKNLSELEKSNERVWSNPKLKAAISDLKKRALKALGSISGGISSLNTSLSTGVTSGIADASKDLESFNVQKLTSISKNLDAIWEDADKLGEAVGKIGKAFESEGFQNIAAVLTKLTDLTILSGLDTFTGLMSDLWNFNVKPITDNADKIERLLSNVFQFISLINKPVEKLLDLVGASSVDYKDTWFHKFMSAYTDFNSSNFGATLDQANDFFDIVNRRLENAYDSLGEWYDNVGQQIVQKIANGLSTKKNEVMTAAENLRTAFTEKFDSFDAWAADKFGSAWESIKERFSLGAAKEHFAAVYEEMKSAISDFPSWSGNKVSEAWQKIKSVFSLSAAKEHFSAVYGEMKSAISDFPSWSWNKSSEAWQKIKSAFSLSAAKEHFSSVSDGIQSTFSTIPNWFHDKFSEAWQKVKDVFSSGGKIYDGIKDGILDGLKSVINALIRGVNDVIAQPFSGLNQALDKIRNATIAGWRPFEGLPAINVPQIPYLAKGAVIPPHSPYVAVVGDQPRGTNIEAPLATIEEALERVYARHAVTSYNGINGGNTYTFVAKINSRTLFEEVIREGKQQRTNLGNNPFVGW